MMMKKKYTPYTYLIRWTSLGLSYYGVRYARRCHPSELMITYFTSSKRVKRLIAEHGLPDHIEIRREFKGVDEARAWEHRVLKRLKVIEKDWWVNKTDNISIAPMNAEENYMYGRKGKLHHRYGTKHSDETKILIGLKSEKRKPSEETLALISQNTKDMWAKLTQEERRVRNAHLTKELKGKPKSAKHRRNISLNHHDASGEKNPGYGKVLAKMTLTGEKLGLISKEDERWASGEIISLNKGLRRTFEKNVCRISDRKQMSLLGYNRWINKMDKLPLDDNEQ